MTPAGARSVHLDAARAFAALLVFASHGRAIFLNTWRDTVGLATASKQTAVSVNNGAVFANALTPSHQAVIIFFVLSGYLVGGSVLKGSSSGEFDWRIYLGKRLSRLWLVLVPALLLTVILDVAGQHFAVHGSIYSLAEPPLAFGPDTWPTFAGNLLFLQGILVPHLGTNGPLWSLSYEFWFYLAFPLTAALAFSKSITTKVISAVSLGAICVVVGTDISSYFSIWLLGLVPHIAVSPGRKINRAFLIPTAVAILGIAAGLIKFEAPVFTADFVLGVCISAWCYQAKHSTEPSYRTCYARISMALSEMSYTLYLVHVPILTFMSATIVGQWQRWPFDMLHLVLFAAVMSATFSVAAIFYLLFERNTGHLQKWITHSSHKHRHATASNG